MKFKMLLLSLMLIGMGSWARAGMGMCKPAGSLIEKPCDFDAEVRQMEMTPNQRRAAGLPVPNDVTIEPVVAEQQREQHERQKREQGPVGAVGAGGMCAGEDGIHPCTVPAGAAVVGNGMYPGGVMPGAGPGDPSVGGTVPMPGTPGMCMGDEGIAPCGYYASPEIHDEMHRVGLKNAIDHIVNPTGD